MNIDTYSVSKTSLVFVVPIRKEGANSRISPTIYRDSEGNLNFVARIDKANIVVSSKDLVKLNLFLFFKKIFRLFLVYNKSFSHQYISSLLIDWISLEYSIADCIIIIFYTTYVCLSQYKNYQ